VRSEPRGHLAGQGLIAANLEASTDVGFGRIKRYSERAGAGLQFGLAFLLMADGCANLYTVII
jgi:hypothetical protein